MNFSVNDLPAIVRESTIKQGAWKKDCPIKLNDLKLIKIIHYNFDLDIKNGEIMVHKNVADNVIEIFKKLFEIKFPIHSVKLINEFQGNDYASMEANNSSAFNFRNIPNSNLISMHSYGLAIDINPVQNPYILEDSGKEIVLPDIGRNFLDRKNHRPGMVTEEIVHIFANNGFSDWGGNWSKADYHHFQLPRDILSKWP